MGGSPVRVFIAGASGDGAALEAFRTHVADLARDGVEFSDAGAVPAGAEWQPALLREVAAADIVVVLASAHFVADSAAMDVVLPRAMARWRAGECLLFPVRVGAFDLAETSALYGLRWAAGGAVLAARTSPTAETNGHRADEWVAAARELRHAVHAVRGGQGTRRGRIGGRSSERGTDSKRDPYRERDTDGQGGRDSGRRGRHGSVYGYPHRVEPAPRRRRAARQRAASRVATAASVATLVAVVLASARHADQSSGIERGAVPIIVYPPANTGTPTARPTDPGSQASPAQTHVTINVYDAPDQRGTPTQRPVAGPLRVECWLLDTAGGDPAPGYPPRRPALLYRLPGGGYVPPIAGLAIQPPNPPRCRG